MPPWQQDQKHTWHFPPKCCLLVWKFLYINWVWTPSSWYGTIFFLSLPLPPYLFSLHYLSQLMMPPAPRQTVWSKRSSGGPTSVFRTQQQQHCNSILLPCAWSLPLAIMAQLPYIASSRQNIETKPAKQKFKSFSKRNFKTKFKKKIQNLLAVALKVSIQGWYHPEHSKQDLHLRSSWRNTRELRDSGANLEKKCPYFRRLDQLYPPSEPVDTLSQPGEISSQASNAKAPPKKGTGCKGPRGRCVAEHSLILDIPAKTEGCEDATLRPLPCTRLLWIIASALQSAPSKTDLALQTAPSKQWYYETLLAAKLQVAKHQAPQIVFARLRPKRFLEQFKFCASDLWHTILSFSSSAANS